jgi:N-methylhydantoinase A
MSAAALGMTAQELLARTRLFLHSTTVAENAVVDGALASAGLLTTRGFEDTLFATRGGYGRWSGLTDDEKRNPVETHKPPPLVGRQRIRGLSERTDAHGAVLKAVDLAEVDVALRELRAAGASAIGVCLLWSIVNPANERAVVERIRQAWPGVFVTASHEIAPMLGEYERTSSVALNVSLGPVVSNYLNTLEQWLRDAGCRGTLLIMQAHGGLVPVGVAAARPVSLLESGPVGGLIGCKNLGERIGEPNIISSDMGGTTFKVGTVQQGLLDYQRESMVLRYHYALPKLDVVSLGLAGGSIVAVDPAGEPRLGPRSAGAYPGPICYRHGGTEPTLTDIDGILGYLNDAFFLDGKAALDIEAAREAFTARVATPLGMDTETAAAAIYRFANSRIYDLLHKTTVQRGLDPRRFALFSTGGTAGMHLPAIGRRLGVRAIVVPHSASVHGAFGIATSDVVHDELVTQPMRGPTDVREVNAIFERLSARLVQQLRAEDFSAAQSVIARAIDMRYRRQVHILTVPVEGNAPLTQADLARVSERFDALYRQRYGSESAFGDSGIELVTFRVRATGLVPKPALAPQQPGPTDAAGAILELRRAFIEDAGWLDRVPGYDFRALRPGHAIAGPAIIWTPITTVVVQASQAATIDGYRNIVIRRRETT